MILKNILDILKVSNNHFISSKNVNSGLIIT